MSVVYMAVNEKANKIWAVKKVKQGDNQNFEIIKKGILTEINLLKKLKHPSLAAMVDVIQWEDEFLIVMDYIEGNPLSKVITISGKPSEEEIIKWAIQLCDVLGYLHSRNPPVIYRDMKPSNIMLKPDGRLVLIDFGTAKEFIIEDSTDTTCLGTLGYAAPEQFGKDGKSDIRSDIYSLGATLYHMATGYAPGTFPIDFKSLHKIDLSLSEGMEQIINKCMHHSPEERYQSCEELYYDLKHCGEISIQYKKAERKKLILFFIALIIMHCVFLIAGWFYYMAGIKKTFVYETILKEASDKEMNKEKRIDMYLSAIALEPTKTTAYYQMLEMFLSSQSGDRLSKDEDRVLMQLWTGISALDQENSKVIFPLEELKKGNPNAYKELCYEIGISYWYEYEDESARKEASMEWLKEADDISLLSHIYYHLGEYEQRINKYAGQGRVEKMYRTYGLVWEEMKNLQRVLGKSKDLDVKIMAWQELVQLLNIKVQYFTPYVKKEEIEQFLCNIEQDTESLLKDIEIKEIKDAIIYLQSEINITKERVWNYK